MGDHLGVAILRAQKLPHPLQPVDFFPYQLQNVISIHIVSPWISTFDSFSDVHRHLSRTLADSEARNSGLTSQGKAGRACCPFLKSNSVLSYSIGPAPAYFDSGHSLPMT